MRVSPCVVWLPRESPKANWSGGFWERRYSAEPVLDDAALVGRLRYVLAHGGKEGLGGGRSDGPGLPARRLSPWFNGTKRWSKRGSEDRAGARGRFAEQWAEPVELEVAPLPCWRRLEERRRAVRGLIEEVEADARARDKPVLGVNAVRAQHPHSARAPQALSRHSMAVQRPWECSR